MEEPIVDLIEEGLEKIPAKKHWVVVMLIGCKIFIKNLPTLIDATRIIISIFKKKKKVT